jgi:hypothetical protein
MCVNFTGEPEMTIKRLYGLRDDVSARPGYLDIEFLAEKAGGLRERMRENITLYRAITLRHGISRDLRERLGLEIDVRLARSQISAGWQEYRSVMSYLAAVKAAYHRI